MENKYDLIVVGSGPGGYVGAIRGAQAGFSVALVEAREIGGTCLNRGCIPTKTLLHISRMYGELSGDAAELGIVAQGVSFDAGKVIARKNDTVTRLQDGVAALLKANKIAVFSGTGTITAPGTVRVTGSDNIELEGKRILLAAGACPAVPPIPGAKLPGVFTSDELLANPLPLAGQMPESLVIIGGGVIGVEMASVYSNFGVNVTVIEAADSILNLLDSEIGQSMALALGKKGVKIHTAATVEEIVESGESGNGGKNLLVKFNGKNGAASASAARVLVSVGRRPNIAGLFAAGVEPVVNRGIVVDEHFQTSIPGVYAVGDCVDGTIQLAHVASAQATNAVCHIAGVPPEIDLTLVPNCIYTNPEVATVGMTEREAKKRGLNVKVSKYLMTGNSKSVVEGQGRGFIKLVFESESAILVGAHLMCARATDMIGEITLAMKTKTTAHELASLVYPHPTFNEGIGEAVENFFGRAVHVPPKPGAR
ncbi:MAG: dihydrolipoyl dehydrogenase [Treponema sp.]|nr:dihydrolipoyl dehydrogenase [Treponema sp.]